MTYIKIVDEKMVMATLQRPEDMTGFLETDISIELVAYTGGVVHEREATIQIAPIVNPIEIQSITDLQARLVLAQIGRLAEVEAMAAADPTFYIWFDRALVWERNNPYVVNAGVALGLTEAQVDDLFVLGATL